MKAGSRKPTALPIHEPERAENVLTNQPVDMSVCSGVSATKMEFPVDRFSLCHCWPGTDVVVVLGLGVALKLFLLSSLSTVTLYS
jgi:hypothetical protein